MRIPGATIIRRNELSLDIAIQLLLHQRSADSEQVWRYGHADSSPMGGYDWMWSSWIEVPRVMAFPVYKAINRLQLATHAWVEEKLAGLADEDKLPADWWDDGQPCPEWRACTDLIKANLFEAILPPAALGSGHRGLAHKASLLAYGWSLGAGRISKPADIARSYISHTSDMGVELSLPDFFCEDLQ